MLNGAGTILALRIDDSAAAADFHQFPRRGLTPWQMRAEIH
jgi:hypothetical protein